MAYTAKGYLHDVFDEQQVSEKFKKREFVLEIPGQYPEHIKFQLVQDKCDLIDPYQLGQEIEVTFNLRGRGFNKNGQMTYFTNLEAWKVQPVGAAQPAAQPQARAAAPAQAPTRKQSAPAGTPIASDHDNDLPF